MHRHQYNGRKLGRKAAPRKALLRNLTAQVILHEQITTTLAKAKEVRPIVEKLITRAKNDTVANRRLAAKFLSQNDKSLEKLFEQLGPLYKERQGGYLRIVKTNNRLGDNAPMAIIQLLDTDKLTKKEVEAVKKPKAEAKPAPKAAAKKTAAPKAAPAAKKTTKKAEK